MNKIEDSFDFESGAEKIAAMVDKSILEDFKKWLSENEKKTLQESKGEEVKERVGDIDGKGL
jgi:hypothetical protein